MSKLVILESPGKLKKVQSYLGKDYKVIASYGHCIDLPAKGLNVNIKNNFEPTFAVQDDKKEIINTIKKSCKKSKAVYLMMDPDREGSGIARNIYDQIKGLGVPVYRASSNEITHKKINEAIANASELSADKNIYDAYLCRRILDRIVGYKTSFLTKQATGGRSAGRVQSAMLRIIAEREKEIISFVPEEYWVLTAHFFTKSKEKYTGTLVASIKVPDEKSAQKIYNKVTKGKPVITFMESKEVSLNPYAPFITSTLIQSASSMFGWTAKKVMKTAQSLYESSHITYMRTDSPFLSDEACSDIRGFIEHDCGVNYLHSSVRTFSKKGSQEGHECCRPTDINLQTIQGSSDNKRMYELIWRRAVACQMKSGKDNRVKVVTTVGGYDFISKGNTRIFDGFRKIWNYSKQDDVLLPNLKKNEKVSLKELDLEQKWTTPPNRYSDASLQKKCDSLQVTRPATFASFLDTLEQRKYINREKKSFHATELGMKVTDFLVESNMCFVDLKFTAELEGLLDDVAAGEKDKSLVLSDFWEQLKKDIENGKKIKDQKQITKFNCPKCKAKLLLKHSLYGPFFSCQKYSKKEAEGCEYIAKYGKDGQPEDKVLKVKEYADFPCKKCGSKMVKRKSKFGEFCGCSKFPSCRATSDLDGNFKDPSKKGKKWGKKKWSKKKG